MGAPNDAQFFHEATLDKADEQTLESDSMLRRFVGSGVQRFRLAGSSGASFGFSLRMKLQNCGLSSSLPEKRFLQDPWLRCALGFKACLGLGIQNHTDTRPVL